MPDAVIDVSFDPTGWADGIVDRAQLLTMSDDEILADLQNRAGWGRDTREWLIVHGIYAVSTGWREGAQVLKARGVMGDLLYRIRGEAGAGR